MESIYLIKGLIGATEILVMQPSFITALGNLLNDSLAICVRNFFDEVDKNDLKNSSDALERAIASKRNLIESLIGEKVKKYSFHSYDVIRHITNNPAQSKYLTMTEEKARREFLTFLSSLRIDTAFDVITDYKKTCSDIDWMFENQDYWTAFIPVRKKEDMDIFECELGMLEQSVVATLPDFSAYIPSWFNTPYKVTTVFKSNKELFYSSYEKPRSTYMSGIIANTINLKQIQHGLHYEIDTRENRVSETDRISLKF